MKLINSKTLTKSLMRVMPNVSTFEVEHLATDNVQHAAHKKTHIAKILGMTSLRFQAGGSNLCSIMGLLPDKQNCGLRMHRECRERFPRQRLQRKPLVSDPGMHHGTCVTNVPWCMSGSLTPPPPPPPETEKSSRHSRRIRNPQFYVSGKRPIAETGVFVICETVLVQLALSL